MGSQMSTWGWELKQHLHVSIVLLIMQHSILARQQGQFHYRWSCACLARVYAGTQALLVLDLHPRPNAS